MKTLTSIPKKSKHGAAGQMAGYLFQPERALARLATVERGGVVGVETLDDLAVLLNGGERAIFEQDKHYKAGRSVLADRSKEFWNTLQIWLAAIEEDGWDLEKVEFHLVTNGILQRGMVFELMHQRKNRREAAWFVEKLRDLGRNPPKGLRDLFSKVLAYSDTQLAQLFERVHVFDGTMATHGASLRKTLFDHLRLPSAHAEEVIQGLLGWVDEVVMECFRRDEPAWITRAAFDERYMRLLYRYQDIAFVRETEEALIPVGDEEREKLRQRLFVKQLQWVGCAEEASDNEILDAIDAYIRAGVEATRLSQAGVVALSEFRAFDQRLLRRWKLLKHTCLPNVLPSSEDELASLGYNLLNDTLNHREPLAGQQTSEYYLTIGAYHRLADDPAKVGWHPNFTDKVQHWKDAGGGG